MSASRKLRSVRNASCTARNRVSSSGGADRRSPPPGTSSGTSRASPRLTQLREIQRPGADGRIAGRTSRVQYASAGQSKVTGRIRLPRQRTNSWQRKRRISCFPSELVAGKYVTRRSTSATQRVPRFPHWLLRQVKALLALPQLAHRYVQGKRVAREEPFFEMGNVLRPAVTVGLLGSCQAIR